MHVDNHSDTNSPFYHVNEHFFFFGFACIKLKIQDGRAVEKKLAGKFMIPTTQHETQIELINIQGMKKKRVDFLFIQWSARRAFNDCVTYKKNYRISNMKI